MAGIDASAVTNAVVALQREYLPNPVGDGGSPTVEDQVAKLRDGYLVVVSEGIFDMGVGYLDEPGVLATCRHTLVGVGVSRQHAEMVRDRAVSIHCDRDPIDNAYLFDLAVADHNVQIRKRHAVTPTQQEGGTFNAGWTVSTVVARAD